MVAKSLFQGQGGSSALKRKRLVKPQEQQHSTSYPSGLAPIPVDQTVTSNASEWGNTIGCLGVLAQLHQVEPSSDLVRRCSVALSVWNLNQLSLTRRGV